MPELQEITYFDWHTVDLDLIKLIPINDFYYLFIYRLC